MSADETSIDQALADDAMQYLARHYGRDLTELRDFLDPASSDDPHKVAALIPRIGAQVSAAADAQTRRR